MEKFNESPFEGKNLTTVKKLAAFLGRPACRVRVQLEHMGIPIIKLGYHGGSQLVDMEDLKGKKLGK
jgi:hypothetical protein